MADGIWRAARPLLAAELGAGPFRLIGVGLSGLTPEGAAAPAGDLLDPGAGKRRAAEAATDRIRARFGGESILKGRALK